MDSRFQGTSTRRGCSQPSNDLRRDCHLRLTGVDESGYWRAKWDDGTIADR
jgi:hypothetical protein